MAKSMKEVAELLEKTHFRRRFLGGVDEYDVWKKLERLQKEYAELVETERQRALGVIGELRKNIAVLEAELRERDEELKESTDMRPQRLRSIEKVPGDKYG